MARIADLGTAPGGRAGALPRQQKFWVGAVIGALRSTLSLKLDRCIDAQTQVQVYW
jgi:hypothetical protein